MLQTNPEASAHNNMNERMVCFDIIPALGEKDVQMECWVNDS